jgi:hypothetical protein
MPKDWTDTEDTPDVEKLKKSDSGSSKTLERAVRGPKPVAEQATETEESSKSDWSQVDRERMTGALGRPTLWNQGDTSRGRDYERLKKANIAGNFPVIDDFDSDTGKATSLKTVDLRGKTYRDTKGLFRKVTSDTDKLADFSGRTWGGYSVPGDAIKSKVLCVGVPKGSATEGQQSVLKRCEKYANNKGVELIIEEVP